MKRYRTISTCLHFSWFVLFALIILVNWPNHKYDPWRGATRTDGTIEMTARYVGSLVDPVAAAAQLGRLDAVSLLLTVVGILVAIGAIVGTWIIRREAIDAAEKEARAEVERLCPKEVAHVAPAAIVAYFNGADGASALKSIFASDPALIYAAVSEVTGVMGAGVEREAADGIASAMGNGDEVGS